MQTKTVGKWCSLWKKLAEGTVHKNVLFPSYVSDEEIQRDDVHCLTVGSFFGAGSLIGNIKKFYVTQNLEEAVDIKIMSVKLAELTIYYFCSHISFISYLHIQHKCVPTSRTIQGGMSLMNDE